MCKLPSSLIFRIQLEARLQDRTGRLGGSLRGPLLENCQAASSQLTSLRTSVQAHEPTQQRFKYARTRVQTLSRACKCTGVYTYLCLHPLLRMKASVRSNAVGSLQLCRERMDTHSPQTERMGHVSRT